MMAGYLPLTVYSSLGYLILTSIYNLFFHPLAKVPGPFLCRISTLPSFYHACKGDRHIWIWQQFQIYGSKFRATPTTVLFNSPQAFGDIYSHKSNVRKSPFYKTWVRNPEDAHVFNTVDPTKHSQKRRLVSTAFTEQSLKTSAPFMAQHIERWLDILGEKAPNKEAAESGLSAERNMRQWSDFLVFDILGELCFGESFETKEPGENSYKGVPGLVLAHLTVGYKIAKSPLLDVLLILRPLLNHLRRNTTTAYDKFVNESIAKRISQEDDPTATPRKDLFHFLYHAADSKTGDRLSINHLRAETRLLVLAGTDTTSTTMSSLFFYLKSHPRVLSKLEAEVRSSFSDSADITYGAQLSGCKYLRAVINETLRLTPPIPSELSREVLPGGTVIDSAFYPAGTIVGTCGWSLGRHEGLFGDANTFRPERWLVSAEDFNTEADVNTLKHAFHPFAAGPTNCIGQNVAILELSMTIARTLWRFDILPVEQDHTGEGMEALGWGQRDRKQFMLKDVYLSARDGPVICFRQRD